MMKEINGQLQEGCGFIKKLTSCCSVYKSVCPNRLLSRVPSQNPRLQVVLSFMIKAEKEESVAK